MLAFANYFTGFIVGQSDGAIRTYSGGVLCPAYPVLTGTIARLIDMGTPYGVVGDSEPRGIPVSLFRFN
jgi:hypothetical protein